MHTLAEHMMVAKVFVVLLAGCMASELSSVRHAGSKPDQSEIKYSEPTLLRSGSSDVVFRLYTSPNTDPVLVDPADPASMTSFQVSECCVVFCVHGFKGDATVHSGCYNISQAFLNRSPCNVITVDWSQLDSGNYVDDVLVKIHEVSDYMAEMVDFVLSMGVKSSCIHLIGHSLGAHISAFTCRKAREPCGWLTGLDPAGPTFVCASANCRFSASDCDFNEAIHTSATFGTTQAVAQCDLLVNYGRQPFSNPQPGCVNDISGLCAHFYAITLYVYAIQNDKALVARQCAPPILPPLLGCTLANCWKYSSSGTTTYVGPLVNKSCRGIYNVDTMLPVQDYQPNGREFLLSDADGTVDHFPDGTCYLKI